MPGVNAGKARIILVVLVDSSNSQTCVFVKHFTAKASGRGELLSGFSAQSEIYC